MEHQKGSRRGICARDGHSLYPALAFKDHCKEPRIF